MAKSTLQNSPPRASLQKNVSIPKSAWPEIEEAMRLDGTDNFSQFALSAVLQRAARIRRQQDLLDARQIAELEPKLRELLARLEARK